MFQRYKLRLGDGTVLLVDLDGLSAWLVDGDAMVQPVGSRKWRPLKEFLAQERAASRRAAASPPAASAPRELPLVPPPPKKQFEDAPRELPLVPPPPKKHRESAPRELPLIPPPPKKRPESPPPPQSEEQAPPVPFETTAPLPEPLLPAVPVQAAFVPPAPLQPASPPAAAPAETAEPPLIGEPPGLLTFADEPGGPVPAAGAPARPWAEPQDAAFTPLKPPDDAVPVRSAPAPRRDALEPPTPRPSVGVLADDPMAPPARRTVKGPEPDDSLPTIPLKPLDDEARVRVVVESEGDRSGELGLAEDVPWQEPSSETALPLFAALGGFLSRWLDRLVVLGRQLPSIPFSRRGQAARSSSGALRKVGGTASAWADGLARWLRREVEQVSGLAARIRDLPGRLIALTRAGPAAAGGSRPEPAERSARPLPPPAPVRERQSIVDGLEPRAVLKPPAPVSELQTLRFADAPEPSVPEDLYEGGEGSGFFDVAWLWTRRVLVLAVLVAGAAYAALTWDSWSPTAAWLSQSLFAEIDRYARPATGPVGVSPEALQAAEDALPHLAPETIRLLASGRRGALDAPDLFYLADEAADRGLSALDPQQAAELAALRRDLLETLSPAERERLRQYDRERKGRAMFAFEKRRALELVARGTRALPAQSRERLQELLARAIATGLGRPSQVAPWDAGQG